MTRATPRLLVTGSRTWSRAALLRQRLDRARGELPGAVLVQGDARGADQLAATLWRSWGLPVGSHPADWARHGRQTGTGNTDRGDRGEHRTPA